MDEKVISHDEMNEDVPKVEEDKETQDKEEEDIEALKEKAKKVDELNDTLLRLSAEFDNYKKRTAKEKERLFNEGRASCAVEFLALADNIERVTRLFVKQVQTMTLKREWTLL